MKSQTYWRERFEILEDSLANQSAKVYRDISRQYKRAMQDIEKDLLYWYERFAATEGLSLAEAKKMLSKGELAAFKMNVREYIKKGESLDPKWAQALERASVRMHVSRLEAMKLQMQQHAEELAASMASLMDEYTTDAYAQQYYHVAYELQKGIGVGTAFNKIDKEQIRRVIRKPWAQDGKNFSERIWDNRTKLVNELHTTLTSAIARGENPSKTISALAAKMETSNFNAGRVIMTESAFINSAATKDALKSLDVEKYEILATLDRRTSPICRQMDGKVFDLKDYEIAVTAPPFHPFCRTTTVPWFEDEESGLRAARNDEGEYYLVPENMTYKDWEKSFLEGDTSKLKPASEPKQVEPNTLREARERVGVSETEKDEYAATYASERKNKALKAEWNVDLASIRTKSNEYLEKVKTKDNSAYKAAELYTSNAYHQFNRPLAGYDRSWNHDAFKGPGSININNEGCGNAIRRLTELLAGNTYDQDIWVKRGCSFEALENVLGLKYGELKKYKSAEELAKDFVGSRRVIYNFVSSTALFNEELPFITRGDVVMNIFAPSGTPMVFVESLSKYKHEHEMLLQRGLTYKITSIKDRPDGKIELDLEVRMEVPPKLIQQE